MLDLSRLNPPQREAVTHGDGPLLVLAGAGSGKTRVLTYRVAYLLSRGWPARTLCALSFTNRAADEMRERVASLVGAAEAKHLTMSTFHSLGLAILKAEKEALGQPRGFTIYDGADQLGVVREALRQIKIDDRRFDPKAILHRISRWKNAGGGPDPQEGDDYDEIAAEVFPRYQEALRAFAAVDFDDLIGETVRVLESDEGARARWGARFRFILVDEYQDTNSSQLALVRALASGHDNVTVVGDDDQSIYSWRGAEAAHILGFARRFPGATTVKLEQNYRSTPTILAAANAVIRNNAVRHAKELWSEGAAGDRVVVAVCPDGDSEAKFVMTEIDRLRTAEQRRWRDFAVLYRSNVQARPFEEAVLAAQAPFVLQGGQEFYERKEVRDVIAYLKLTLSSRDDIALRRVINYPARGIGATTVERLAQWAQARRVPLWEALVHAAEVPQLTAAARAAALGFVALVEQARRALGQGGAATARLLVDGMALYDDLRAAAAGPEAARRRIDHVEEFLRVLGERDKTSPGPEKLRDYLHVLSLRAVDDDSSDAGDRLTLSTLHGAKGLEWPIVFLVGVEEELLPHARTLYPHGPDVALSDGADHIRDADVSEERRLAYVGITRARERLYLSRALSRNRHGRERPRAPSRFLTEIPADLLEVRNVAAELRAPVGKDELVGFFRGFGRPT